jgi:signal transduction histidine kinase/DNA-binding response OmpR family regulator
MTIPILSVRLQYEHDVVAARQRTRQIAEALGFDSQQQTRLATAVSEIARNAVNYAGGGRIEFSLEGATAPQVFAARVSDGGPGIAHLDEILSGRYRSGTGMGLGIIGAQRLMDRFRVETSGAKGTSVFLGKLLPRRAAFVAPSDLPRLLERIKKEKPRDILDEFREQNQELMRTLDELRRRQEELISLNRELEDTNRGVVALYAELDEKADHLRRADEVKSRFLSNMSHEFRTPLSSITALSRLLLDHTDGDLTSEQEIQVGYIRKSAESLTELVNDLLDLAKVEAGKIDVRAAEFDVASLFGALRGMLRPLLVSSKLSLVFEQPEDIPPLFTDEGKVSQILRNFISNALKYTEAGEVRVSAEYFEAGGFVTFGVSDTGIGIAPEHQEAIFEEFRQIEHSLQQKVKGTGLGLPLSRRLAHLLGGSVGVESQPGLGSVFSLRIPAVYKQTETRAAAEPTPPDDTHRATVLLLEDHYETRLLYEKYLRSSPWRIASARSVREAENILRRITPVGIVLDIALEGEDSWDLLARLKSDPATARIPILVVSSVDDESKSLALGADAYFPKPIGGQKLRETLERFTRPGRTILLADDEEISRYLLRQTFSHSEARFLEAGNGRAALQIARAEKPDLVIMDLVMPDMNGFAAIDAMRSDAELKNIPVIVATSGILSADEENQLSGRVLGILPKSRLSSTDGAAALAAMLASAGLADLLEGRA